MNPLKQGLKPTGQTIITLLNLEIIKEVNPLKQGLKLYSSLNILKELTPD